jgi:hypothetical protein
VITFRSALEYAGVANQVFHLVYYISRRARKVVVVWLFIAAKKLDSGYLVNHIQYNSTAIAGFVLSGCLDHFQLPFDGAKWAPQGREDPKAEQLGA